MPKVALLTIMLTAASVAGAATASSGELYVQGELIVGLVDSVDVDTINVLYGTVDVQTLPQLHVWQVNAPAGANLDSLAELIEQEPFVEFCHPNYLVDPLEPVQGSIPFGDDTDPEQYSSQAAANTLGLSDAQIISSGESISVAILDGGINFIHPAFEGAAVSGWDYVDDDGNAFDEPGGMNSGHGTFVAGVVHLVAPEAEIRSYRVTNLAGESNGYIVAEAILQAVADGCRVINLSMVMMGEHEAIAEAVQYARDNDVLVVVAAGNGGNELARYPASDPNTMAVAAVDSNLVLADFSSFGDYVDICAPGTMIYSPYLDSLYAWWGGTSFAAPFVTAMSALLLSFDPELTWDELRGYILDTASPLDSLNPDYAGLMGAGLISPFEALMALRGGSITIHVPSEYPTIQMAIDSALAGDTILVAPGTYYGMVNFLGKSLTIMSEQGPEVTILRPMVDDTRIVYMEGIFLSPPELIGFTLTGLNTDYSALALGLSPTIVRDCIFHTNQPNSYEGVVSAHNAAFEMTGCLFYNNGGRALYMGNQTGGSRIVGNTFNENVDALYGFFIDTAMFRNNLITNNSGTGVEIGGSIDVDYSNVWNNGSDYLNWQCQGDNDISEDPLYVDPLRHDYRLLPGSPCIDAGDPDPQYNDADGSRADIGAYPAEPMLLPLPINVAVSPEADLDMVTSLTPTFHWDYYDTSGNSQAGFDIEVGTDKDWSSAELWDHMQFSSSANSIVYGGVPLSPFSVYYYRLRLRNAGGWGDWLEFRFTTSVGGTINVPADVPTIQAAVDVAIDGDTILVAPGTYIEAISVVDKNLAILSTNGPDVTTIEASSPGVVLSYVGNVDTTSILQGFTVSGGLVGINCYQGAAPRIIGNTITGASQTGVYAEHPEGVVIRNNTIRDNGAAVAISRGTAIIQSNQIIDNEAPVGTSAVVALDVCESSVVSGNVIARNGGQRALRVSHGWNQVVEGNTIYGNRQGGLNIQRPHDLTVRNNLVAFNVGTSGIAQFYTDDDDDVTYEYNNSYGNYPTDWLNAVPDIGNLSDDPLFADTTGTAFELLPGSPCVDAGHPDPQYNDPDGTRNDIGATPLGPVSYPLALNISATPEDSGIVLSTEPDIIWAYTDTASTSQAQYHLQIGDDMDWTAAERWDTGPLGGSNTSVTYAGASLDDLTRYFVRVRVHDGSAWGDWCYGTFMVKIATAISVPGDVATIQGAIDLSRDGDTIWVSPGTYQEQIDFRGRNILLKSTGGPEVTFIEPIPDVTPTITFSGGGTNDAVLEGFGLVTPQARVEFASGSLGTLRGNHFIGVDDLAVYCQWGNGGVIEGNLFDGCGRPIILFGGYWQIIGNEFINNLNDGSGGTIHCWHVDSGHIAYNVFAGNEFSAYGGAMILEGFDGTYTIHNNTIVNNTSDVSSYVGAIHINRVGSCTILNNIIAFNESMWGIYGRRDCVDVIEYNDVFANGLGDYDGVVPGAGCFPADPLLVDTAAGDYSLSAMSPCIDAGHPGAEWADPDGSNNDIGALPYDGPVTLPIAVNLSASPGTLARIVGDTPTVCWTFADSVGGPSGYEIEVGIDNDWAAAEMWSSGQVMTADTSAVYSGPELVDGATYYLRIRLYNGSNWGDWRGSVFHANAVPTVPTLVSPADGAEVSIDVQFVAAGAVDSDHDLVTYEFEVYADSNLTDLVEAVSGLSGDTVAAGPISGLLHDREYFWRVQAFDGYEHSVWTEVRSMTTVANISLEYVSGGSLIDGEIYCDGPTEFIFRLTNNYAGPVREVSTSMKLYSVDATWELVDADWYNPAFDWSDLFDLVTAVNVRDGAQIDTMLFGGASLYGPGLAAGAGENAWRITIRADCSQEGRTICIDSSLGYFPNYWHWYVAGDVEPSWDGPYCFTIQRCCYGGRGDVNGDGTDADIADAIFLVSYMFQGGPEPLCRPEANINGDAMQAIDITDLVYLVGYMFNQGAAPLPCDSVVQRAPVKLATASPRLIRTYASDTTVMAIETPVPLSGLQMSLAADTPVKLMSPIDSRLELYYHQESGTVKVGILDIDGAEVLPAGTSVLCTATGDVTITSALAADLGYHGLIPEIDNEAKAAAPVPRTFALHQNYPNPFNAATVIKYDLPRPSQVRIDVYNILGQTVATLVDGHQPAGYHQALWNGQNSQGKTVASGVYLYRIETDENTSSRKMLLLK